MNEGNVTFDEFIKNDENRQQLSEALSIVLKDRIYPGCTSFKMVCKCFNVPEYFLKEAMIRKETGDESFLDHDSPVNIETKIASLLKLYLSGFVSSLIQSEKSLNSSGKFISMYSGIPINLYKKSKINVSNKEFFYFFKDTIPSADLDFIFEILESYKRVLENRIITLSFFMGNDPTFESEFKKSIEEDKDAFHLIILYHALLKMVDDKSLSKEDLRFCKNKLNKLIEDGLKQALLHANALYD